MEITDAGEINSFETMPTEGILYLSVVMYSSGAWMQGPSGMDKALVINTLSSYMGVEKVRIYSVKVPLLAKPA